MANIFPSFPEAFQNELISLVKTQNLNDIDCVFSILKNYHGEPFLHEVCREIIIALPEGDKTRLNEVEAVLESTGVVRGEFGLSEAYKAEVDSWLTDENPAIRAFTERYVVNLDRSIAVDHRRAQQEIELRKRYFE